MIFISDLAFSECSDLDQSECEYWSEYCSWNSEQNICEELGGGGGGNYELGPYEVLTYTQNDGMQLGDLYADVTMYYPADYNGLLGSIVLGAGLEGNQESMENWAYYFSSNGFVSATIQYNDPVNDSHGFRAEAILELISSIKMENDRPNSQLYNALDTTEFAAVGYSLSGGSVQLSAVLDSSLSAVIALNPTIITEDCNLCIDFNYCICLVPEFLDHSVPTLIIAGQNELDELTSYDGLLGQDQYHNTPESTTKMLYEIGSGGHSSSESPGASSGSPGKFALHWLNYFIQNDEDYCDSLLIAPENSSQFLTTLECDEGPPPPPPSTNIGYLRQTEASFCMDDCGMYHLESEDGEFLYNVANQNNIPNFEYFLDRFVEIEGDTIQCIECSAVNVSSIFLSNECEQPVSCFVEPCTVSNCTSSDNAECFDNYCGGCHADYYYENELFICENPGSMNDLSSVDFGECEMMLGFGWVNNHCSQVTGCGFIIDDVNYSDYLYSSLFDCISASTLGSENEINPTVFKLYQNHPNPFNPTTKIRYQLAKNSHVKISIYNMMGKLVKILADEVQSSGFRSIQWNGKNSNNDKVSSGVYFYSIQSGEFQATKKMILLD
ncbi:MAG: T9SS type A sorting domain-containing protein [Candidatus Neomarinimicrobiota bacterium]